MMLGLGDPLNLTPGMTPLEQFEWAQSLVNEDYCKRLACGAITQEEAGTERIFACGLAHPQSPQAWCSDFCLPYREDIEAKYGPVCGSPSVESLLVSRPMPAVIPPPSPEGEEPLPRDLFVKNRRTDDAPQCGKDKCCVFKLGCCCFTMEHLLALGVIGLALVWRR